MASQEKLSLGQNAHGSVLSQVQDFLFNKSCSQNHYTTLFNEKDAHFTVDVLAELLTRGGGGCWPIAIVIALFGN